MFVINKNGKINAGSSIFYLLTFVRRENWENKIPLMGTCDSKLFSKIIHNAFLNRALKNS